MCSVCFRDPPPVAGVLALFRHEGAARHLVHDLKYRGHRHLAGPLGEMLATLTPPQVDLLVPVPLHPIRRQERGFDQAALLAQQAARYCGRDARPGTLRRTRPTQSQTDLHPRERAANVHGAFDLVLPIAGKRVLLVDDVCTTGATLYECARILRRGGALEVYGAVVTRA